MIIVCSVIVIVSAVGSRLGLILTKDIDLYPSDLFLYVFLGTPVLLALYIGAKEKTYPYRVTLSISLVWSVISFLVNWQAVGNEVALQTGLLLAFVKEGVFYAAFLVAVCFMAHKVALRFNKLRQ